MQSAEKIREKQKIIVAEEETKKVTHFNEQVLDEKPLAASGKYQCEFDQPTESTEKEDNEPLEKRIDSKNWKTRGRAYEDVAKLLKTGSNSDFARFAAGVVKFFSDPNPAAQEKSIEIVVMFLCFQPEMLIPQSEELCKALIEKGMASNKASIKSDSLQLLLDFFACHKTDFEGVVNGLNSCINNKNIKIQAAGIVAVNSIISAFGIKKIPYKSFLNSIEKCAAASSPQVRSEALNFYKEVYRWIRELIKPSVEKLKNVQQDELNKAFEEIKDVPVPTRWLKHEEHLAKAFQLQEKANPVINLYEIADAKDIFTKYNEKWVSTVLAMEKWAEKKQALEELNNEANYPKLAEKNPIELVTLAKRLINDSNLQVMLQTMKLVGLLAKGLRKFFENFAKQFFPQILQKLKEKKAQVIQEAYQSLDNLMFSLSVEQVQEDVKTALEDANPLIKANTLVWLDKLFETLPINDLKIFCKVVAPACKRNIEDPSPEVRNSAFKIINLLQAKLPDQVAPLLKDLPQAKIKKLETSDPQQKPRSSSVRRGSVEMDISEKPITPALMKKIADTDWKVRKEGLEELEKILECSQTKNLQVPLEVLVKSVITRLTDPNKSIVRQSLIISAKFASALGTENKNFAKSFLPAIMICLTDKQNMLRQDAMTAINKWAEETGIESVVTYSAGMLNSENPELRIELLKWLLEHKESFKSIDMKIYAVPVLACLQDRSAQIRNLSESLFGEVVELTGFECFQPHLKDIKPAVMNALNLIFDKYRPKEEIEFSKSVSLPLKIPRSSTSVTNKSTSRSGSKERSNSKCTARNSLDSDSKSPIKRSKTIFESISLHVGLIVCGPKLKRLETEGKIKWGLEDPRPEHWEKLKELTRNCFTPDLYTLVFHADFKKQVEGLGHIAGLIKSNLKDAIEVVDILLKYSWIRLQEASNTQVMKAVLDMLHVLVSELITSKYTFHEMEAELFFPILCERIGFNNIQFKSIIKNIIHFSTHIFPKERVFSYVLQGCSSKNSKTKVECLEELGNLIQEFGVNIVTQKDIKSIAKFANSPDNNVRTSAVHTIGEVYKLTGEKIWTMIGEVNDKTKDLLEQRFRALNVGNTGAPMRRNSLRSSITRLEVSTPKNNKTGRNSFQSTNRSSTPLTPKQDSKGNVTERHSVPRFSFDGHNIKEILKQKTQSFYTEEKKSSPIKVTLDPDMFKTESSPSQVSVNEEKFNDFVISPTEVNHTYDIPLNKAAKLLDEDKRMALYQCEVDESLLYEPIKFEELQSELDKNIETLIHGDMSTRVDALVAINDLILNGHESQKDELKSRANQLAEAISIVTSNTFERSVEDIPLRFAKYFLNVVHKICSTRLIMQQVDEISLFHLTEQILMKLIIEKLDKIGEKGEGEIVVKTLNGITLRILESAQVTRIMVILIQLLAKHRTSSSKMPGLIIRCLLKLTKTMNEAIDSLEADKVLVAVHEYIIQNKSVANDDLGIKTVRSIVTEMVKLLGIKVWKAYDTLKQHPVPDVHIEKWVKIILSSSSQSVPTVQPSPVLTNVFSKIKSDYPLALRTLFEFMETNPSIDISNFMNDLPSNLRLKLQEDLKELKQAKISAVNEETGYNFHEFQKRLLVMKEKYGIPNSEPPTQINSAITDLKAKVSTLLNKNPPEENQGKLNDLKKRIQSLNKYK